MRIICKGLFQPLAFPLKNLQTVGHQSVRCIFDLGFSNYTTTHVELHLN